MTSNLTLDPLHGGELADFGQARLRDSAFDAVHKLWLRRLAEGMTQTDLANRLGKDPAWVSRTLKGPANWTFRTFGALVEALDGEAEIAVIGKDEMPVSPRNYRAYEDVHHKVRVPKD